MSSPHQIQNEPEDHKDHRGFEQRDEDNDDAYSQYSDTAPHRDHGDHHGFEQHDEDDEDAYSQHSGFPAPSNHAEDTALQPNHPTIPEDNTENSDLQRAILASMRTTQSHTTTVEADAEASFKASLRQDLAASLQQADAHSRAAWEEHEHFLQQLEASLHPPCPICQGAMAEARETPCGHAFCYECLVRWLEWSDSCPRCGGRVRVEDVYGRGQ